jgi:hypothetical protein
MMASPNTDAGQIPVINLSGSLHESQVAKELVDAAATYGFVYIKNQGKDIPVDVVDGIFDLVSNRVMISQSPLLSVLLSVPSILLLLS